MCPHTSQGSLAASHVGAALDTGNGVSNGYGTLPKAQSGTKTHNMSSDLDLIEGLRSLPKRIPVRFLYDTKGSDLYEEITQLQEYYPYEEEKTLLKRHAEDIIAHVPRGAVVVELGCGDGSKTSVLLNALAQRDGAANVHFLGVDVSAGALQQAQRNLQALCPDLPIQNLGLCEAEYLQGMVEARKRYPTATLCILWLGSSVGNFTLDEAAAFLGDLRRAAGPNSALLLCTDLWKDEATLHAAYDDSKGVTREFIINGMCHALRTLGHPCADHENLWTYEAVVNKEERQVEMWVEAREAVKDVLPGVSVAKGERILIEISRKFTPADVGALAQGSGMCLEAIWSSSKYSMQLLLPVAEALKRCWRDTDALFAHITDWTAQPIGLRHPFAFYYGHMSAFLRLKVLPHVPPTALDTMLSRGVDPIVLDPTQCHSHPEVPATWPSKPELEQYTAAVRADIMRLVQAASAGHGGPLDMHALVMALEHEHMHQETLTYMVAQQRRQDWEAGTPRAVIKNTKAIAAHGVNGHANGHSFSNGVVDEGLKPLYFARCSYVAQGGLVANGAASNGVNGHHADFVTLPSGSVTLGLDPAYPRGYVWDNELGTRGPIDVKSVSVGRRAITVAEFMRFVKEGKGYGTASFWRPEEFAYLQTTKQCMPATWSLDASGEVYVHMPEGTFHWTEVSTCPVYASLAEARACAAWLGGRIMTEAEHHHATLTAADEIADLNCGGWEWTCSPLEPFDGFQADPLYPEYSTDFFDDCHFVLRGASPYTHPSMKRATFRNFYQPLYGYVFAKFRIVKDL